MAIERPPLTDEEVRELGYEVDPGGGWRLVNSAPTHSPPEPDRFDPQPWDWDELERGGVPEPEYLDPPYLAARSRVWAPGPTDSGKSIWAAWRSCLLSRAGVRVVYISQENPADVEVRRWLRLRPDKENARVYHWQGFDLAQPAHVARLIEVAEGAGLVVIDTLTGCWTGDENDNAEIAAFDRTLAAIVEAIGATVLVLDHSGHDQPFVRRAGATAGRGASSKGQKADVVIEFRPQGEQGFTITHGKNRYGAKEPKRAFRVVDTADGGLDVVATEVGADETERIEAAAETMVAAILAAPEGFLITGDLRARTKVAVDTQTAAMNKLRAEDPPRVVWASEKITRNGKPVRADVWRPA